MIVHGFLFRRQVICRVAKCIFNTQLIYQTVYVMWFTHKSDIAKGLNCQDGKQHICHENETGVLQYFGH